MYYDEQASTTTKHPHRQGVYYPCKPSRESFPPDVSPETLARHGFYPTKDVKPDYDPETEQIVPTGWVKEDNQYVQQYEIQPLPIETMTAAMRSKRDALLSASDKYALPDYPLTGEERAAWKVYRQALRDITTKEEWPYAVEWPKPPE